MIAKETALDSHETKTLESRASATPRLLYVDNMRIVLITAVVLGHLSVSYGAIGDWYYSEIGEGSSVINIFLLMVMGIGAGFAMGLFFMIAGYFTPAAYDRKGPARFLLDRFKRLGIPWLVYEVLINPFVHYIVDVQGGNCRGSFHDCQFQGTYWQYLEDYPNHLRSIGDGPVWFLEALLIFSVFYALWRLVTGPRSPTAVGGPSQSRAVPNNRVIALFALAIGMSTFVVRFWVTALVQYEPLHLEFARFPQYIALFVAGLWAYRRNWLVSFADHQARIWRWITLVCVLSLPAIAVAAGALSGTLDERAGGGVNWLSLANSHWEGFLCVAMAITILTWFRRHFDHQGRLARAMSKSTLAVYVIHPAIIVPLALALSGIQMQLNLKFLLVAPLAITLCYLVAYTLHKTPLVRNILA